MRKYATKVALRCLIGRYGTYQPVMHSGKFVSHGRRGTVQRFEAMLPFFRKFAVTTVLDHGCAEGYVVRRCAESGITALGIDQSRRALAVAQTSFLADGVELAGLMRGRLDVETVKLLPETDATVSLSLMHHIMYDKGFEYAKTMMSNIRHRTQEVLIFEMGQSNETEFNWSKQLPDMGSNPHDWIASFLEECGYSDAKVICTVPSFNSSVQRATFVARPREIA